MSASIYSNSSFTDSPYGLKLQQTFTTSGSVTIPTGINRVYAIVIGGGGAGSTQTTGGGGGGGAGGYSAGWTYISNAVTVGSGGTGTAVSAAGASGGLSIYGMVMAGGGVGGLNSTLGGAGGGATTPTGITSTVSYTGTLPVQQDLVMLAVVEMLVLVPQVFQLVVAVE
jgi:hypothetical protein